MDSETVNLLATIDDLKKRIASLELIEVSPGVDNHTNYVTVDASGAGDYATLTAALTAIADAASNKRYVVVIYGDTIEPAGVIKLKEYVSVIGSKKDTVVTCDGLRIGDGAHLWHRAELVNLYLANLGAGTIGLDIYQADEILVRSCGFANFATGVKVDHYASGLIQFEDSSVSNCVTGFEIENVYSMQVRGCNLNNNATQFKVQVCMSLAITDTAFETFDTAFSFDNTATAVSALGITIHNCRFLSAAGGVLNTCRVIKSYSGSDEFQGVVRGLALRNCQFWLTHAAYVAEVAWNGHLSGGSNRFIATLDDLYIQGDFAAMHTTAWIKSDVASDGFVNISIGDLMADDKIAMQDGTQPIVTGYGHFGLDLGAVAGASNGPGTLWGKTRWGSDGSSASRIMHGFANLADGTVVVNTTQVTNSTMIFLSENTEWGNGYLWVAARTPGVSFTIQSSNTADNCLVAWMMIEP